MTSRKTNQGHSTSTAEVQPYGTQSLLESDSFPVKELARLAKREGQRPKPIYQAHRWFARRRGSQFRGILIGLHLNPDEDGKFWNSYESDDQIYDEQVIIDPFLGGGTSLVEASRLGARVIGIDIDPVPTVISRFQLEAADLSPLDDSLKELKSSVGANIRPYHRTLDEGNEEREVLYHFWVQVTQCRNCETEIEVHPHHQLAYDTSDGKQWAFCRHCQRVQELSIDREVLVCDPCDRRTTIDAGSLRSGSILCLDCRAEESLADNSDRRNGPPQWRLFAQQYLIRNGPGPRQVDRVYKRAKPLDYETYREAERELSRKVDSNDDFIPTRKIPTEGRSDSRPILHGFEYYSQLFNKRQLLHLSQLARELNSMERSPRRRALALAFSEHLTTNNMLVGYAFGYERTSPLFSYQSFRHITRPVEVNPWLHNIGRGTYPNAVSKINRAIRAASEPTDVLPNGETRVSDVPIGTGGPVSDELKVSNDSSVITARSSEDLSEIPDNSVDFVITDPPYGDNISYSELSDFYLAWHQLLGIAPGRYSNSDSQAPLQENLSASGRTHESLRSFKEGLTQIFSEMNRLLTREGRLVFTFRHIDYRPWEALANALHDSGFHVTHTLPMRGEGSGGLKNHPGTIKWDAVLTCCPRDPPIPKAELSLSSDSINRVESRISRWTRRLTEDELEFTEQDAVNLTRAFLVQETLTDSGSFTLRNKLKHVQQDFTSIN